LLTLNFNPSQSSVQANASRPHTVSKHSHGRSTLPPSSTTKLRPCSIDLQKLHVKNEGSVGWDDTPGATGPIRVVWAAGESGTLPDAHDGDALVPGLDHLAHADGEHKGL
jgi:hypothetical protein